MEEKEEILKQALLAKRSQRKSLLKSTNHYKLRWFILTKKHLRYHDGNADRQGRERGRLHLASIKMVEAVADGALERDNAFQVGHGDRLLYIVAPSAQHREDWITTIRKQCVNNEELCSRFHPGIWKKKRWSCCGQSERKGGCTPTWGAGCTTASSNGRAATPSGSLSAPISSKPNLVVPKVVTALFPFKAIEEGDLSLQAGEEYTVVDASGEHWWQVRSKHGAVGYIPSNYVEEKVMTGLGQYKWYVGEMSRQRAESLLQQEAREGTFMVRNSSSAGMYTLSLYAGGQVKHYHICTNSEGKLFLTERRKFSSLEELVTYHRHDSGGLASRLRQPARRLTPSGVAPELPASSGLAHGKWEIDPSELSLLEELGSGQFGVVRRGKWRGTRDVAVKMMKEGTMSEDDFIEEAKLMTKLQHTNLVQLYGVCSKHRPIFIVAEYMKYGSLLQFLRRHEATLSSQGPMLLDMCLQVASGMAYLESHNYIHRDLAARNCLVGEGNVVKVADFGLARYVIDDEYTSSGGAKFPIKWAPPEVLGYTRFSSKSDVWAYGVLMWEVYTCGKIPYGRAANAEVVERVQHGERLARPRTCPRDVYRVMRSCWEKKPDARPSFSSIKGQLEKILEKDS
ncbi:tyrosine-protein kinase Btk-like [Ornithodoros turicata]|uniref:tyrosine-protein kinase Btk-like n=1 Tax=Ornithodoros turicata TaxID=34597 RepID=UPI0031389DE6